MSGLIVLQGVRTVQLTKDQVALVDESDYPLVGALKWQFATVRHHRYAHRYFHVPGRRHRLIGMHRFLLGDPPGKVVDHKNGDGLDNRRKNLRECTYPQNIQNSRKVYGRSAFKGVSASGSRWRARIMSPEGRRISLGTFDTEAQAAQAYDIAAGRLFGEFAAPNAEIGPNTDPLFA